MTSPSAKETGPRCGSIRSYSFRGSMARRRFFVGAGVSALAGIVRLAVSGRALGQSTPTAWRSPSTARARAGDRPGSPHVNVQPEAYHMCDIARTNGRASPIMATIVSIVIAGMAGLKSERENRPRCQYRRLPLSVSERNSEGGGSSRMRLALLFLPTDLSDEMEKPFTARFIDAEARVRLELTNTGDETCKGVEILAVFLKDEETPGGGTSRAHIKFDAMKSMLPKESAV